MSCAAPEARQEALAELGEMASRMAHEIRNPLNAIRMQVAVIRNKLLRPDPSNLDVARGQLERLEIEVLRVEKLARSFLEFGRPPADEPEEIDLVHLLEDVVALVRPEFEAEGHRLEGDWSLADAADLRVRMDRAKLHQVLHTLLGNARNAVDRPGRICVSLARTREHEACIRVQDSGCGIPPEELPEIFLPFHTFGTSGDGLGLAIAKKIVDAAGGCIRVESRVGQGSCFEVVLPLMEAQTAHLGDR